MLGVDSWWASVYDGLSAEVIDHIRAWPFWVLMLYFKSLTLEIDCFPLTSTHLLYFYLSLVESIIFYLLVSYYLPSVQRWNPGFWLVNFSVNIIQWPVTAPGAARPRPIKDIFDPEVKPNRSGDWGTPEWEEVVINALIVKILLNWRISIYDEQRKDFRPEEQAAP